MVSYSDLPRNLRDLVTVPVSVDTPEFYARASREARAAGSDGYHGTVISSPAGGQVRVAISGEAKTAGIAPTAKAIQNGDRVKLIKTGGKWIVYESLTWHEPPKVGAAPPTTTPNPAQSTSWTRPLDFNPPPGPPRSSVGTQLNSVITWCNNARAHLIQIEGWNQAMRDRINRTFAQVDALTSRVSGNAASQNQIRDIATGTRDATTGLRDGALQDGVVQP